MKLVKNNVLLVAFGLASILLVASPLFSPEQWWVYSLLAHLAIPILLINITLVPFFLYKKHWFVLIQILILGVGIHTVLQTYVIPSSPTMTQDITNNKFRVLSYNTSFFRVGHVFSDQYYSPEHNFVALNMRDWLRDNSADIICLQEFFDDVNSDIFNNIEVLKKEYEYKFTYKALHENGTRRGLVTFSKFPIVDYGVIFLSENRYNGAMYTDVKIFEDTLRIINVHLESNNLLEEKNVVDMLHHLKKSNINRSLQVNDIIKNIQESPHKVIVCGDFNDPPYSYIYQKFDAILTNSFEKINAGFGSTYSGTSVVPYLRIDNQFVDPSINTLNFVLYEEIDYSDHLPIEGEYSLSINEQKPASYH